MLSFKEFLVESDLKCKPQFVEVKWESLQRIQEWINQLWQRIGVDVYLGGKTAHFFQRLNDARNGQQISLCEIQKIFLQVYSRYGKLIASQKVDWEAVMQDLETSVNIPFFLEVRDDGSLQLRPKSILRKKNFSSPDPKLPVA
jgi:hypothetical protein